MSLVQGLRNPGCKVEKSLGSSHHSGCAEGHNRYNVLFMEEIKESKDSVNNKIISNSILLSEGSRSGLARDIKPGFNSSNKNHKNITKENIPEDTFVCSIRPTQEICLPIQITPASSQNNFTKLDALLDSGTNAIFINKT